MGRKPIVVLKDLKCPYCQGKNIVKRGLRRNKLEVIQLYQCNNCQRTFSPQITKGKTYPLKIILDGISYYNIGYSLEDSGKFLKME